MYRSEYNLKDRRRPAFTLVEVAVTIVVIGLIVGSAITILERIVGAMADMRLRANAFELARQNMESLLASANVQDKTEYGVSEIHPEIQWQTVIEPFYEPVTNAMWVRAVCSAGFNDSKGQYQSIELEHWLTNLSAEVVRQIIQQQKAEEEYLDLLSGTSSGQEEAAVQETTIAYLEEAGLDVDEYQNFLERQRRKKLDYIAKNGFDDGYEAFLEDLREDENKFLDKIGVDFDKYNVFARTYVPRFTNSGSKPGQSGDTDSGNTPSGSESDPSSGLDSGGDNGSNTSPQTDSSPRYTREDLKAMGFSDAMIDILLKMLYG